MATTFAPTAVVDGVTVEPEGWMWVLGFAMGGCEWAIKEVSDPLFDLRGKVNDYQRRKQEHSVLKEIEHYEQRLEELRAELKGLRQ